MNSVENFSYLSEREEFESSFMMIPKALYTSKLYRELSNDAIILYGILLDRFKLSAINNMRDNQGRVYVVSTIESTMELLNVCKQKASKVFNELIKKNLLRVEKIEGFNKTRRLYLGKIGYEKSNDSKNIAIGDEKESYEGLKNIPMKGDKTSPNNTYLNNTNLNKYRGREMSKGNYSYLQEFDFED